MKLKDLLKVIHVSQYFQIIHRGNVVFTGLNSNETPVTYKNSEVAFILAGERDVIDIAIK